MQEILTGLHDNPAILAFNGTIYIILLSITFYIYVVRLILFGVVVLLDISRGDDIF